MFYAKEPFFRYSSERQRSENSKKEHFIISMKAVVIQGFVIVIIYYVYE